MSILPLIPLRLEADTDGSLRRATSLVPAAKEFVNAILKLHTDPKFNEQDAKQAFDIWQNAIESSGLNRGRRMFTYEEAKEVVLDAMAAYPNDIVAAATSIARTFTGGERPPLRRSEGEKKMDRLLKELGLDA